jgi:cobalt/nickel transport system permease protein
MRNDVAAQWHSSRTVTLHIRVRRIPSPRAGWPLGSVDVELAIGQSPQQSAPPDWLLKPQAALCPCGSSGKRRKRSYLEKTLTATADVLRQVMFSDDTVTQPGFLQRFDPRIKIVALFGLLIVASLLHTLPALLTLYAGTLVAATCSRLPLGFFVKRVWLFVPIFTAIVLAPATLSVVTGGEVIVTLWHWQGHAEGFTRQGLVSALRVVCRVAASVSLVVLLTLTTPWNRLLAALRSLGVPRMFVLIVGMAYRYLFLLLGTATDMYQARKARTASCSPPPAACWASR